MLFPTTKPLGVRQSLARSGSSTAFQNTGTHVSPSTPHTYGTPTQMVASVPFDVGFIALRFTSTQPQNTTQRTDTILELMVGGSGSEQPLFTLPCGYRTIGTAAVLPVYIPAGSRLSIRHKGNTASKSISYGLDLFEAHPNGPQPPSRWVAYGLVDDNSNSRCMSIEPSTTANTWGRWYTIAYGTTYPHELWVPLGDLGTTAESVAAESTIEWAIETAADAPTASTNGTTSLVNLIANSNETVVWDTWWASSTITACGFIANGLIPLWQPRAAGAFVSARVASNINNTPAGQTGFAVLAAVA